MIALLALLATADGVAPSHPTAASIAKEVSYSVLEAGPEPAFCERSNTQFDDLSDARQVVCASKPKVTSTQIRSKKHAKERSWTVRIDEIHFASDAQAKEVQRKLLSLASAPFKDKLQLSWCPRGYFWSGTVLSMVSAQCGAQTPFCEVSGAFLRKTPPGDDRSPIGILGGEGGAKMVVAEEMDIESFEQCAKKK